MENTIYTDSILVKELEEAVENKFNIDEGLDNNLYKLSIDELKYLVMNHAFLKRLGYSNEKNILEKILKVLVEKELEVYNTKYREFFYRTFILSGFIFTATILGLLVYGKMFSIINDSLIVKYLNIIFS